MSECLYVCVCEGSGVCVVAIVCGRFSTRVWIKRVGVCERDIRSPLYNHCPAAPPLICWAHKRGPFCASSFLLLLSFICLSHGHLWIFTLLSLFPLTDLRVFFLSCFQCVCPCHIATYKSPNPRLLKNCTQWLIYFTLSVCFYASCFLCVPYLLFFCCCLQYHLPFTSLMPCTPVFFFF